MKKILSFIIILSLALFPIDVSAATSSDEIEYLSNGDYIIFTIENESTGSIQPYSKTVTKSNVNIWKITSSSSGKSKNTASATATAKHYYNNSVVDTVTRTVKLTCSSTGKFS